MTAAPHAGETPVRERVDDVIASASTRHGGWFVEYGPDTMSSSDVALEFGGWMGGIDLALTGSTPA